VSAASAIDVGLDVATTQPTGAPRLAAFARRGIPHRRHQGICQKPETRNLTPRSTVSGHGFSRAAKLRREPIRHPLGEQFNLRLRPRTFSSWWWGRHYGAADSTNTIVDGGSVLFNVIVTSQVEGFAHALNVSFRKQRANIHLKARRFRHCASQVLDYADVSGWLAPYTQEYNAGEA
jgi:hypothetical protein